MKKASKILWGIVVIAFGVLVALKAFGVIANIFFDGWWTLFIIVPCAVGLFTEREKTGNFIGVVIGVFLLLCCQDILDFALIWKMLVPVVIIFIGLKMVFGGIFGNKANEIINIQKQNGKLPKSCCATFSGSDMVFDGEVFDGAELTAVFGGVKCDLRGAIIEHDCAVTASAIFGGIDILLPPNVNVKVNSNSIFGGFSNKIHNKEENAVTIYISGTAMFGGVDIK